MANTSTLIAGGWGSGSLPAAFNTLDTGGSGSPMMTAVASSGQLVIAADGTNSNATNIRVKSSTTYDLDNWTFHVVTVPSGATIEFLNGVDLTQSNPGGRTLGIRITGGGNIVMIDYNGPTATEEGTPQTYSAVTHKYIRMRYDSGTDTYYTEYSANYSSWSTLHSLTGAYNVAAGKITSIFAEAPGSTARSYVVGNMNATAEGGASTFTMTQQPTDVASGAAISPSVVVTSSDSGSSATVTATKASGTGTLGGTTTAAMSSGVATFSNLVPTGSGSWTLAFDATGHTQQTSASFTVSSGGSSVAKGTLAFFLEN